IPLRYWRVAIDNLASTVFGFESRLIEIGWIDRSKAAAIALPWEVVEVLVNVRRNLLYSEFLVADETHNGRLSVHL
ncbi:hypothetical protein PENTCL1PPCAC_12944, partial [Pristionchus entomophagus]